MGGTLEEDYCFISYSSDATSNSSRPCSQDKRQLFIAPQYISKTIHEKHRRRQICSFAPPKFKQVEQVWCARRCRVHAELFDRHCSPPWFVYVPKVKLLPDDTYEPVMPKNLPFLILDFFVKSLSRAG